MVSRFFVKIFTKNKEFMEFLVFCKTFYKKQEFPFFCKNVYKKTKVHGDARFFVNIFKKKRDSMGFSFFRG